LKRIFLVLAATALLALPTSASAITDGELDNGRHPHVGLMVAENAAGQALWRCSGTLISPTVFLTAGHCTEAPAAQAEVWFTDDVESGIPGNGYPNNGEVHGTTHTHPQYDPNAFFLFDLGIVVLDEPVNGVDYADLPTLNQLDRLKPSSKTTFTAVGYGLQNANKNHTDARRIKMLARPHLIQINTGFVGDFSIMLSNNARTGGTCFGDSGGANFIGSSNTLAGVTSYGLNGNCAGTGGVYRIDKADDLNWINTFLD
jgi:V8-like Glu-specific endopeptidase